MTFTFSGIQTELKNQLSLLSSWANILYYGVYQRIIDAVAYITNKTCYLAYFLYNEACWLTATKPRSINQMSWFLNYDAHRKIGASGNILFSASSTFNSTYVYTGKSVSIPKWSKFCNTSKTTNVYCIKSYVYYNSTVGNLTLEVREGLPKEFTYTANGNKNEVIYLYSNKIDNDIIDIYEVDINGDLVSEVSQVRNQYLVEDPLKYYCTIKNSPEFDYISLTFGDGLHTKQLEKGTKILIKYAETLGDRGNIVNTGIITKINSILYNSSGVAVSNLYVTNSEQITGGDTYEDIESIRNNAPNLFVSGYRCGTSNDWSTIVSSYSYIYKAKTWTGADIGESTLLSDQNKVYVSAINSDGDAITSAQQIALQTDIEDNYSSPTEIIEFIPAKKIYLFCEVTGYTNISADTTTGLIKTELFNEYGVLNSDFNRYIYQSNYISVLSSIQSLYNYEIDIKMMDYNLGYSQVDHTFIGYSSRGAAAEKVLIVYNTPQLWIKRKIDWEWRNPIQIGYASGIALIGMNGYTITSSSINYVDYTVSYIIPQLMDHIEIYGINNPTEDQELGYIVSLVYQTQDGNGDQQDAIRLANVNTITDIDTSYIFTSLVEE